VLVFSIFGLLHESVSNRAYGIVPAVPVRGLPPEQVEREHDDGRGHVATDRRHHEVYHASSATERLRQVRRVVSDNDAELIASLTLDELATLLTLLGKLADSAGLPKG
jgi:hypothetical protein